MSEDSRMLVEEDRQRSHEEVGNTGLNAVKSSLRMKLFALPVTVACGFLSTYLGISYLGAEAFGAVLLITGLIQFLPFADLGVGAVVMNAMSSGLKTREIEKLLVSAQRLLLLSGGVLLVVALALTVLNLWPPLLGPGVNLLDNPSLIACAFVVGYGFAVVMQMGLRVLMGRGRNPQAIAVSATAGVFSLATTALTVFYSGPVILLVLAPVIGLLASGIIACSIALSGTELSYWRLLGLSMRPRFYRGVRVANTAFPMLIVMIGLALALQTQKLIISHFGDAHDLAVYGVASQIYSQAWAALASILVVFWRRFNVERASEPDPDRFYSNFWKSVRRVSIVTFGLAMLLVVVIWFGSDVISHGQSRASVLLSLALSLLLWIQATHYLGGMLLTSPIGLRFQAICVLTMVGVAIPLSIWGVSLWGAVGAAFASLTSIVFCQLVPTWVYIKRKGTNVV